MRLGRGTDRGQAMQVVLAAVEEGEDLGCFVEPVAHACAERLDDPDRDELLDRILGGATTGRAVRPQGWRNGSMTSGPACAVQGPWLTEAPEGILHERHHKHQLQELHPVPSSWLTAQQVQDLLEIDSSTVYRMAGDGRLPAVRIGRQWRFPAEAIDALLVPPPIGVSSSSEAVSGSALLPPGLATAALEVIAPALGVTMVVTDLGGRPITDVVNPAPAIATRLDDAGFITACTADWRSFAEEAHLAPRLQPGRFGFLCAHSLVRCGSALIAMVLAGGIAPDEQDTPDLFHLDADGRRVVLETLPRTAALLSRIADDRAHRPFASAADQHSLSPVPPDPT
jgi:excisionase family DNA binding protein